MRPFGLVQIGLYLAVGNANHLPPWGGIDMLLSTNPIAVALPASRFARSSGHRRLALGVDAVPSVIESPKVTTAPTESGATASTRATKYQDGIVRATGNVAFPT